MAAILTNTADVAASRRASSGVVAAVAASLAAAMARARARHDYRRLLECDEIMRDVGVTRDGVRRALMECGGRL